GETVSFNNITQTYNGSPRIVTTATNPNGSVAVSVTYNGTTTPPTNAGSYNVVGTVTDPNYQGTNSTTLTVNKATASVALSNTLQSYDGSPKAVTVTTSNPSGLGTTVTYNGTTTPPSAVGNYTVVATVVDANYTGGTTGSLTIKDTTPPVLTLPGNITAEATSAAGAIVTFSGSATDNVDGSAPVTFSPPSGSTFPLGTTTVTATATDHAGNTAHGSFTVTVRDTTPPVISVSTATDFSEDFSTYTPGATNTQYQTGLTVGYLGDIPGWTKIGLHSIHAVDLDGRGNWAVMIWQDNVITSTRTTADNVSGADYVVHFNAGPAVDQDTSQVTTADDGLLIQILRGDGSVLKQFTYLPGPWAGGPAGR